MHVEARINKCMWKRDQRLTWLGFVIDTVLGQNEAPRPKLDALSSMIKKVAASPKVKGKQLASIFGKVISKGIAFGPVNRFMMRSICAVLESRELWWDTFQLSPEGQAEHSFCSTSFVSLILSPFDIRHLLSGSLFGC